VINILIFGSCVSRDALEFFPPQQVNLVGYYARSSFASLTTAEYINSGVLANIPSKFQARVVKADMNKSFWSFLTEANFDILLVDLIDERFNINLFDNGAINTLSADYVKALKGTELAGKQINRYSDKKFNLWKAGFNKLVGYMKNSLQLDKLKINKVYWSEKSDIGENITQYEISYIRDANLFLDKMYSYIENNLGRSVFIEHDPKLFVADSKHKWGVEPFHYTNALYLSVVEKVSSNFNNVDTVFNSDNFKQNVALNKALKAVLDGSGFYERGRHFFVSAELYLGNFSGVTLVNPIDWQMDPFGNRTWQWFLNWFSFISDFIAVDHKDNNDSILVQLLEMIEDWSRCYLNKSLNEPFEFIWHDHATALRAEQVTLFILYIIKYRYDWYKQYQYRVSMLLAFLERHADLLHQDDFYTEHTNHGLEQARVLLMLSTVMLGVSHRDKWHTTAVSRINSELNFSFTEEGVHVENSPAYHYFVLKIFLGIISSYHADTLGELSDNFRLIATKALEYLTHIIQPNGKLPVIGDSDEFRVADIFNEYFSGTVAYEHFLYVMSTGKRGTKPSETVKYYPKSGYLIARDKWGEPGKLHLDTQFIFKAGCLSQYHRHQDEGSFILHAKGRCVVVDSGLFNHHRADPIRKYVRSRAAHNVVLIRGGVFQDVWHNIKDSWNMLLTVGTENTYVLSYQSSIYKDFVVNRQLRLDLNNGRISGTDHIVSNDGQPFIAEVLFHIAPELKPNNFANDGGNIVTSTGDIAFKFMHSANTSTAFQFGMKSNRIFSVMSKVKNEYQANYVLKLTVGADSPSVEWDITV